MTNGIEAGTQQVTAAITDDDPPPTVSLSLAGSPLAENAGVATVTATLNALSGRDVTVQLGFGGQDLSGSPNPALEATVVNEGLLLRVQPAVLRQTREGTYLRAVHRHRQHDTGGGHLAVD